MNVRRAVTVTVGSASAMKVAATRRAFGRFWKRVRVSSIDVPSGVPAQPVSFGEIARGARARAREAWGKGDFSVGIEAGSFRIAAVSGEPFQITLACVFDGEREGMGAGPFFELPRRLARQIVKADTGSVALVTKGRVKRQDVTRDAVVMALAPFVAPDLYA